jgi:protein-S-isoprenylcysteine O-methyltransferase Ste14
VTRRSVLLAAPRLLFLLAVAVLTGGLVRYSTLAHRGGDGDGALDAVAIGMLAAYLAWFLVEAPVTFRRAATAPADSRTLVPYALSRISVCAGAAFGPLPWSGWSPWLLIPIVLFVVGVAGRQIAIRTLGQFYSHHVMRQDGHRVVSHGLYRVIRHPAYAGMLLANASFAMFFVNPVSVVALLLLSAAVVWRIRVEERALWTIPEYPTYAVGRARLVPGVW